MNENEIGEIKPHPFIVCKKCSGVMKCITDKNKSPLIMECQECKHREWAEIQIPPPWPPADMDFQYVRVVVYKKPGEIGIKDVQAFRKLSEELGSVSIAEAVKRVKSSSFVDLGVYCIEGAQKVLDMAESYGLMAELENPEKSLEKDREKYWFFKPFGAPVTVGSSGEDVTIIPFLWIIISLVILLGVIVWFLVL